MMNDSIHKTASGNVVYLELVDFSDKTDAEQIDLKSKFNALVKVALKVPQTHTRIVTDTVEGVIVTTLGAPEEVLQIAANMQNIVHQYNIRTTAPVLVGFALHSGQVQIVNDIHDQPQVLGDAIKLAQRIASFAQPNEILATQAFVAATAHLMQGETNVIDYAGILNERHDLGLPLYAMHFTEGLAALNKAFSAQGPAPIIDIKPEGTEPPIEVLSEFKGVHWPYALSGILILVGLYALVQTLAIPNEPTITMTSAEIIEPPTPVAVKQPEVKQPTVFDPYGLLPNETIEELPAPQQKSEEVVAPVIKPEKTIRAVSQIADEESEKLARKVFAEQLKLEAQSQAKTESAPVVEQNKLPEVTLSATDTKAEATEAAKTSELPPKEEHVKQPEAVAPKVEPQLQTKDNEKSGWGVFTGGLKKGQVRTCSQGEIALGQCR
jgi:hypothetical protein